MRGDSSKTSISPPTVGVVAAFAAVYILWGSTYLAIRYGVETIPPLTMAGVRFLMAGTVLYAWAWRRGVARPTMIHWRSAFIIGTLLLLGGNGAVCWAEQRVPSSIAALLVATVPLWMVLLNSIRPGGVRAGAVEIVGVIVGFAGLVILVDPFASGGAARVDRAGAAALVFAAFAWAIGSLYSRHATRPHSPILSTGMEMLGGGVALMVAGAVSGEWARLDVTRISLTSILALAYLIVFGALIGFTAYMWLLRVSTPSRVATYAYVNPVIAVLLGWAIAGEPLAARIFFAMAVILSAVILITTYGPRTARAKVAAVETTDYSYTPPAVVNEGSALRSPIDAERTSSSELPVNLSATNIATLLDMMARRGPDEDQAEPYLEFHRSETISAGLYILSTGATDPQTPHTEDEVYYVVRGRAMLRRDQQDLPAEPGSILFVPAGVEHGFHSIEEELVALVLFAPPEHSRADGATVDDLSEACSC